MVAKSAYEQAISLWPEVSASERLQALQLQREEEESAAAHSEAGMKPRVQDAKSRLRALISIAAITCVTVFSVLIWQACLVRQREEIALGTMDVLHEEISMIQAQLDTGWHLGFTTQKSKPMSERNTIRFARCSTRTGHSRTETYHLS